MLIPNVEMQAALNRMGRSTCKTNVCPSADVGLLCRHAHTQHTSKLIDFRVVIAFWCVPQPTVVYTVHFKLRAHLSPPFVAATAAVSGSGFCVRVEFGEPTILLADL